MLPTLQSLISDRNYQLESKEVNPAFGEVNITRKSDSLQVSLTILIDPSNQVEGWQTGVALDCSRSMKPAFGGKNGYMTRGLTEAEYADYSSRGLIEYRMEDGIQMTYLYKNAREVLMADGLLEERKENNVVEEVCRQVIPMLAGKLDADGGTTVIYWAAGEDGSAIQLLGDLTEEDAATATYDGVEEHMWGHGTQLMPAINYFLDTFADADMGFYIYVTDGKLDDFEEVKQFTAQLSRDIYNGKRKPVKFVLIGVGNEIDVKQLEELDDLPDTLDLPVDIWDHKVASEMRSLLDIFAELVDENQIIAPSGIILDEQGNTIREYSDGLPAKLSFSLPLTCRSFSLLLPNGNSAHQKIIG